MNVEEDLEARAEQILKEVRSGRMRPAIIADSRCPHRNCGRLLAASILLPDGYWLWYTGHRFSRDESLRALHWYYMGLTDPEEWSSEAEYYESARQAALEDLPGRARLNFVPTIMKVIPPSSRNNTNPLPFWFYQTVLQGPKWVPRDGVPIWEGSIGGMGFVTCGCHRDYRVNVHELFRAIAEHATDSSWTKRNIPVQSVE
ncbi:hypothetical protein Ppa06_24990 [Planomonospora parontospora subsp. parontospora]|uniref:Uncharacterized protein n=2 Tax=Planomonospora parontospora TaxID=58119 RepID=A0AA37BER2_9ACTN|nr:hypothetical protein GCM10010126_20690 [Planomonospora parontospora]GII08701.1 hypothetical protein Ppa06_24990 [Planomonospora parontospora subsp. parontospora]